MVKTFTRLGVPATLVLFVPMLLIHLFNPLFCFLSRLDGLPYVEHVGTEPLILVGTFQPGVMVVGGGG